MDIGADGTPEDFRAALQDAIDDDGVDAVVAVFLPPLMAGSREFGPALREVARGSEKPILASFLSTEGVPPELAVLDENGMPARGSVPSYSTPERAVIALAKVAEYARWRRRPVGELPELADVDDETGKEIVRTALGDSADGRDLTDDELIALLAAYGVPLLATRTVTDADAAVAAAKEIGYPVVLKSTAPWLRHRSDLGGVRLDLVDDEAVRTAFGAIPSGDPVIVQQMAAPGVATVVEVVDDPSFGALVSFGLGGVATDLLGDRAYRTLPLTDLDAAELVRAPRAWPLLDGYRGSEPVDVDALEDLLLRVARLADDLPEVLRLRLEPVIVGPREPVARRPVAGRRRRHLHGRPADRAGGSGPPPDAQPRLTSPSGLNRGQEPSPDCAERIHGIRVGAPAPRLGAVIARGRRATDRAAEPRPTRKAR